MKENIMDRADFEIAKKCLAVDIANLVSDFVNSHGLERIDVSAFITNADASITDSGEVKYGKILHCVVDADMEREEGEDYE